MSLTRKIAHNTIIQMASKVIAVGLGVVTVGIMARYLGQSGFGQYSTIVAFLQFFGILVDFGLQLSMVNLMSKPDQDEKKMFNNTLTLRIISAAVFFIFAPIIILAFPYDEVVKTGTAILTLNFFALAINQILIGLFQKKLAMHRMAIAEVTGRIILLLGVIYAVQTDSMLLGILWAIVISTFTQVVLAFILGQKFIKFKLSFEWPIWKRIVIDSWPIAISIAFNLVYFKADTLILSLTRSQADVGIYSAPYRMLEILMQFPFLFMGLMLPVLASAWSRNNINEYKEFFQKAFNLLVMFAIPMVVGTLPLADRIMVLIAGEEFAVSGIVLQIIIFATAIIFINALYGYSIVVLNKQRRMIWAYIFTAALALTLYLIYIPLYGYIAAAIITVVAELLMLLFNIIVSTRASRFIPSLRLFWLSLIASIGMYVIITLTSSLATPLVLAISLAAYFIFLYLLGGIRKEMVLEILKVKS